jgi:DNA primase
VLDTAAQFYRSRLKDAPAAIEYLKGRGLSGETAKRFSLGFAPSAWRSLEAAFADYEQPELVIAGLVIQSEEESGANKKRYDRFRDRVMFPIRNPRGQTIGFGGRVMGSGEPKYLNSPETPLFVKGRELYGLFEGREAIRQANAVLVVEGYMDVVMLAQHGVGNAVATLGTATTANHIQKLTRLVDRITFSFDGDKAGRKAAWRALEAALPNLSDSKQFDFLFLPAEHDPDSFVREHGQQRFEQVLAEAVPLSQVLIEGLAEGLDLSRPEGRAGLQAAAKPLLQLVPPVALRGQLLRSLAVLAQTDVRELERYCQLDKTPVPEALVNEPFKSKRPAQRQAFRSNKPAPVQAAEHVQWILAAHPSLVSVVSEDILPWLTQPLQRWVAFLREMPLGTNFAAVVDTLQGQQPELGAWLLQRAAEQTHEQLNDQEATAELQGALSALADQAIRSEIDAIALRQFGEPDDRVRYDELSLLRRSIKAKRVL